jgi:hypothetical protein
VNDTPTGREPDELSVIPSNQILEIQGCHSPHKPGQKPGGSCLVVVVVVVVRWRLGRFKIIIGTFLEGDFAEK